MADQKEDSFKVIDRRPFTSEGELRKEALEEEKRESTAAAFTSKQASGQPTAARLSGTSGAPQTAPDIPPSRTFQNLVNLLTQNAAMFLGGYTDPRSGQAMLDLDGAREIIDMLDVLYEKTRGMLAPSDEQLLLDVLGSLKMSYLEMTKAATGPAMKKDKAKSRP